MKASERRAREEPNRKNDWQQDDNRDKQISASCLVLSVSVMVMRDRHRPSELAVLGQKHRSGEVVRLEHREGASSWGTERRVALCI